MFRNHGRRRMTQKGIEPRITRNDTENDVRDVLTTKYSKYSKGGYAEGVLNDRIEVRFCEWEARRGNQNTAGGEAFHPNSSGHAAQFIIHKY